MKIVHLSDLHFGTELKEMLKPLIDDIRQENPDVIVITGDFTQRALRSQFQKAVDFLKTLAAYPILCVPGNHDISLHNLIERFFYPFHKYQHYISDHLNPHLEQKNTAILGINSVTPYKTMQGKILPNELNMIKEYFDLHAQTKIKIVALHHNLIRSDRHKIISNAETFIETLADSKVNLVLSGHLHYACLEPIKNQDKSHQMYVITAGTAVSRRLRQGQNSYNVITINENHFRLIVREYNKEKFIISFDKTFSL